MGLFGSNKKSESKPMVEELNPVEEVPALPDPVVKKTVIAEGVILTGTLSGEGVVQVEGDVEGKLDLTGAVAVVPSGLINGPVRADAVRIAGHVVGCVYAREHMRVEKTGRVEGDVATPTLVVEEGARLNGRVTMKVPASEPSASGGALS